MKLISRLNKWLHRETAHIETLPQVRAVGPNAAWLRGMEGEYASGATLLSALEQSAWVYACVTAISEQVAHIPFVFSWARSRGEMRVPDGDAVRLFQQPDPNLDRFMFWEILCQWLLLRGKAYIVVVDDSGAILPVGRTVPVVRASERAERRASEREERVERDSIAPVYAPDAPRSNAPRLNAPRSPRSYAARPTRLVILNPDRLRAVVSRQELLGYHYSAGLQDVLPAQSLLPEEVISLRMSYAYNTLEGLSPLSVALLAAQTDYAAAQCMKGLMLNNADAGQIVTTEQHLTPAQIEQVKAALLERKRSAGRADRPLFLSDGAKVQTPELSMADLQFLENRKFNRQEICAIFRVPQEVLGYTEDANRAVAEAVRQSFLENRIAPFCQRLESALDPVVKMLDPDLWGFFDIDALPIMQAARRTRYQSARQGFEMGIPLAVLNEVFDLGLPPLAHGDQSFLPGNWQELGGSVGSVERGSGNVKYKMLNEELNDKCTGMAPVVGRVPLPGADTLAGYRIVRQLESRLSRFFFEQRSRVLARLRTLNSQPSTLNLFEEDHFLLGALKPLLLTQAQTLAGLQQLELSASDLEEYWSQRETALKEINANTARELEQTLRESSGESPDQLAARARRLFTATAQKARNLAATEHAVACAWIKSLAALAEEGEKE